MNEVMTCENCEYTSSIDEEFELKATKHGDILYCKDCFCCQECREIITGLKK